MNNNNKAKQFIDSATSMQLPDDYLRTREIINETLRIALEPVQRELAIASKVTQPVSQFVENYSSLIKKVVNQSLDLPGLKAFVQTYSNSSIHNIEWSTYNLDDVDYEEYIPEIVEQISNDVKPEEIAQNLEKKTGIKWEIWIPIILTILQLLWNVYSDLYLQKSAVNNYNHIEINIDNSNNIYQFLDDADNDINHDFNNEMQNSVDEESNSQE